MIKLLKKIPTVSEELLEDYLEVYKNHPDHLNNNLRLKEISILIFLQFYCKINREQLEILIEVAYSSRPKKYFEVLNLTIGGRSQIMKRFGCHSNSRGEYKIRDRFQ